MSKKSSTSWSHEDLIKRGYRQNNSGGYDPPAIKSKYIQSLKLKSNIEKIIDTPKHTIQKKWQEIDGFTYNKPKESFIEIHGVVAGLNGPEGLMRGHWTKIKKIKDLYCTIVRQHLAEGKARNHEGKVRVKYIGYKTMFMDWDNYCASFKHIGDSLVKEGIITDDSPKVIIEFVQQQIKCKREDQKVVIIIEDIHV